MGAIRQEVTGLHDGTRTGSGDGPYTAQVVRDVVMDRVFHDYDDYGNFAFICFRGIACLFADCINCNRCILFHRRGSKLNDSFPTLILLSRPF